MKDEEINAVVLNYLKKKGYTHSLKHFEEEAGVATLPELAQKVQQDPASITNYILFHNAKADSTADDYINNYSTFKDWVNGSLNTNRAELRNVLFPVFVHCYLDLIEKGFTKEAITFMTVHGVSHREIHPDEINNFTAVKTREQLQENELAQTYRNRKHIVKICSYTFELMLAYLMDNKLYVILALVNQYVDIRVFMGAPNEQAKEEYKAITGADEEELNEQPIRWGLLPDLVPNKVFPDEFGTKADETQNKKRKLFDGVEFKTAESKIPLPAIDEEGQKNIITELGNAIPLGSTTLPSICCYTFLNTSNSVNTIEISRDCSLVAAGCSDSSVKLWDVNQTHTRNFGTIIRTQDETGSLVKKRGDQDYDILHGHSGPVYSLTFSPENKFLLSSSEDSTVRLWSMETKTNLVCYKGHNYPVWDVDFSPLGYYFASASHDRTARIWSTEHIFPLRVLAGHLSDVDCVKFHPNCNYVATGSSDKSVRLWDVQKGECVRIFTGHFATIYCLAFSPDGRILASGDGGGNINLWDIGSGKKLKTFTGHQGPVWSVTFSQEGSILASGSGDSSVKIWNTEKNSLLNAKPNEKPTFKRNTDCPELLRSFPTKKTPIQTLRFTSRNLLFAAGVFSL